ncbi:hypothetical protein ANCCEY_15226 [Ancylostoma ceylanicum]|uniref:Gcp-like domain-containing protein n=1 Tax=Ancylostoma ceylanicum TaxID=53326 RepID=A0A0D6LD82_9BILA|nr:hypothetical protein ANCCEY_15226 [Ancylostoma ceylanicum]
MEIIGSTIDDAAGEAFDKSAKLLGFPYPGGPLIDKHARNGNPKRFEFNNAAMIAITGKYMYDKGLFADQSIAAKARIEF